MKKIITSVIAFMTTIVILANATLPSNAIMAYNLYSDPQMTGTSGKIQTFSIDFMSDKTPYYTYWALSNFSMALTQATKKKYKSIEGGGAYAGLQDRGPAVGYGHSAIMSFWEWSIAGNKKLYAEGIYPQEYFDTFDNEGSGAKCIQPFAWEDNTWYRMVLHTWEDKERNTTFAGQWFQNLATGEYTLLCYYDTKMVKSYFNIGHGLFQENYSSSTWKEVRSFYTKNIYVFDYQDKNWISVPTCKMSYGNGGRDDKQGSHTFGATDEYFWGISGGEVENQAEYEKNSLKSETFTINQPDQPTFGTLTLTTPVLSDKKLSWGTKIGSTPQLSYLLKVVDESGKTVFEKEETRPEVQSVDLSSVEGEYKCILTVTDIFGNSQNHEIATEGYSTTPAETVTVTGYKAYVDEEDVDLYLLFDEASVGKEVEITVGDKTEKVKVSKDGISVTLAPTATEEQITVKFGDQVVEEYTLKAYLEAVAAMDGASDAAKAVASALLNGTSYTEYLTSEN